MATKRGGGRGVRAWQLRIKNIFEALKNNSPQKFGTKLVGGGGGGGGGEGQGGRVGWVGGGGGGVWRG